MCEVACSRRLTQTLPADTNFVHNIDISKVPLGRRLAGYGMKEGSILGGGGGGIEEG